MPLATDRLGSAAPRRAQVGGDGGATKGGEVARRRQLDVRRAAVTHQPRVETRCLPAQAARETRGTGPSI